MARKKLVLPEPQPQQRMWIRIVVKTNTPIGILNSLVDYAEDLAFGIEEDVPYFKNRKRADKATKRRYKKRTSRGGKPFANSASHNVLKKIKGTLSREDLKAIYVGEGLSIRNFGNWLVKQKQQKRLKGVKRGHYDLNPDFKKLVNA